MKVFTIHKYKVIFVFLLLGFQFHSYAQKTWDGGAGTNNWDDGNNWNPNGVPTAGQTVTIGNGFNVILNTSTTVASLTIGGGTSGSLIMGNNNTNRSLTISGNVTVSNGATFNTAGNGGNAVLIGGNLVNNGTFDMRIGGETCDVIFNGSANQTLSGTGGTTDFNLITINNTGAANSNIVEIMPSNFTAAAGFLTLTQGIIKMSGNYTFTNTFIPTVGALITINADEGIWLNNPNVTVTAQNSDLSLSGLIRVTAGTFNVGTLADWWLFYNSGALVSIEGGALNVSGAFFGNLLTSSISYTQSGGIVTVNTEGNSGLFGPVPSFGIEEPSSIFNMSGGTIVLQRLDDAYTDFINLSTNATVTGGTLQVGNASSPVPTFNYWINSTPPLYNLTINSTNGPTGELRATTTVLNDVTINTTGSLDASTNNNNLSVGHNFINNGIFVPQLATVTFNGNALQAISGTSTTTFYDLTANNTAGVATTGITLQRSAIVTNILTLTSGHITTTATNILTMNAGSSIASQNYASRISGGSDNAFINGPMRKIGNSNFLFPVGKINPGHHYIGISAPSAVSDVFEAEYMRFPANALGAVSASGLYHVSNCEYWRLDEVGPGTPTVNVTLSWNGRSGCNFSTYVNDFATLVVAHFNGATWDSYGNTGGNTGTIADGSVTWNGVSTFSPFALGSTSAATNPLPVKLANVKAYNIGERNKIEWTNLTETDVLTYEVERSVNGTEFTTMSTLAPKSNTNAKEDYFAYDIQRSIVTYYRIKVTGNDGKIIYSPIVKVIIDSQLQQDITLYPNPVTGSDVTINFNAPTGRYSIELFNTAGQRVLGQQLNHRGGTVSQTIALPVGSKAGMYSVRVIGENYKASKMLIVQ